MKSPFLILTLIFAVWNSFGQTTKSADKNSEGKEQSKIYVKDKSQYDLSFLDGLSDYKEPAEIRKSAGKDIIRLIDNYIIVSSDTTYFPDVLNLNEETNFKGIRDKQLFELKVTRINQTTLIYDFRVTDKGKKSVLKNSGKAVLGSMFFLGCEIDRDELTGESYSSYEYWRRTDDFWLSIRICTDKIVNGKKDNAWKLRAKVTYWLSDNNKKGIDLQECPTMRTE